MKTVLTPYIQANPEIHDTSHHRCSFDATRKALSCRGKHAVYLLPQWATKLTLRVARLLKSGIRSSSFFPGCFRLLLGLGIASRFHPTHLPNHNEPRCLLKNNCNNGLFVTQSDPTIIKFPPRAGKFGNMVAEQP